MNGGPGVQALGCRIEGGGGVQRVADGGGKQGSIPGGVKGAQGQGEGVRIHWWAADAGGSQFRANEVKLLLVWSVPRALVASEHPVALQNKHTTIKFKVWLLGS